jgi:MoaA/NifB/PqqE/SkfB family radical SAM enzyme
MDEATWNLILDNLEPWRDTLVKFCPYSMQEPLLDKTIFKKIEDIYSRFPRILVELSTNGAALTRANADKLLAAFDGRKHSLVISHHGVDETSLAYLMKIDYQKAHDNLIHLLQKSDGRFNIIIRGAGASRTTGKSFFDSKQYEEYFSKMFEENQINTGGVKVRWFMFHDRAGTLHRKDRDAFTHTKGIVREIGPGHAPFHCPRIDDWIHIMHDGSIRICSMDYHHEVRLPNIREVSLVDYFRGPEYRKLVDKAFGRIESEADFICKRCTSPGG